MVGLFAALVGLPPVLLFTYFMALCFIPVIHSYVLYQKLGR